MRSWPSIIRREAHIRKDFEETLDEIERQVTLMQDNGKWEDVLEARGAKRAVRYLRTVLVQEEVEAREYADYMRKTGGINGTTK